MKRYPSSFLQLVTIGYLLVVIPFLLVTGYAFIALEALDEHYRVAIEEFSKTSLLTEKIAEDAIEMERSLRHYEILKDAGSLNDYAHARTSWRGNVESLSHQFAMPERVISELQALITLDNQAYAATRDTPNKSALLSAIDEIRLRLQKVRDDVHVVLVQDQAHFKNEADALRQRLLLAMGIAVLAALCSVWAGRLLFSRLLGSFEKVVVRLGKGDLQHAIDLHGPGDMRWLGRWLEWLRRRLLSLEETRTQVLRHVSHALKTPLAALREGDFSVRGRSPRPDDALGEVMREVNTLGGTLREQRLGAMEATTLLRTVMRQIGVAIFAFDEHQRLRLVNGAGDDLDGLLIDRYHRHIQVQFLSEHWHQQKIEIGRVLMAAMPPGPATCDKSA